MNENKIKLNKDDDVKPDINLFNPSVEDVIAKFCNPSFNFGCAPNSTYCNKLYNLSNIDKIKRTLKFVCDGYNYYLRHNKPAILSVALEIISTSSSLKAYNDFMKTINYVNEQVKFKGIDNYASELLHADNGNALGNIFFSANMLYCYQDEWKKR